jgi:hypothetical protein
MSAGWRQLVLSLIGVAALVLALIVLIRNNSPDDELLASIAVLGGLAIVIVALPKAG